MRNQDESKNGLSRRGLLWTSAAAALGAVGMAGAAEQPAGATPAKSTDKPADKPAPKPAPKNETPAPANPLKIAVIGCGGQGRSDMRNFLQLKERIVALCDVDEAQIAGARKAGGEAVASAKSYTDYRKLFEDEKTFDTVLIATPDHWHAPIAKLAMKMGKHVYCEKPLTHSIAEARELGELARSLPKVVTQLGNQGSADGSMRRSVELIRAGVLGQIRDVHSWLGNSGPAMGTVTAVDADPIPDGFNWDMWCGPSPLWACRPGNSATTRACTAAKMT